jgi:hypothetical protein
MGNQLYFDILPFDPNVVLDAKIQLPIDLDDFAQQLRDKYLAGEVHIDKTEGKRNVTLSISTEKYGPWIVAGFIENHSYFYVSGWPKRMAKELILWYRHLVPMNYPLFLVIPEDGFVAELTAQTTLADIEKMYPFPVADE